VRSGTSTFECFCSNGKSNIYHKLHDTTYNWYNNVKVVLIAALILAYGELFIQDHARMSKRRRYKPQSTQQVRTIISTGGTAVSKPAAARPPHHPRASRSAGLRKKIKVSVIMTINSHRTNLLKGCAAASSIACDFKHCYELFEMC
jgi:hypothetical protein